MERGGGGAVDGESGGGRWREGRPVDRERGGR